MLPSVGASQQQKRLLRGAEHEEGNRLLLRPGAGELLEYDGSDGVADPTLLSGDFVVNSDK